MVRLIARVLGVGVETADMLVNEVFSRHWRDRKAVARYAGLTGSPDESGKRRRERGLARAGMVTRLDRLARSTRDLLNILDRSARPAPASVRSRMLGQTRRQRTAG